MKKWYLLASQFFDQSVSSLSWVGVFLSMLFLRNFLEQFVAKSVPLTSQESLLELIHNLYFFLLVLILLWLYLSLILRINPSKLAFSMCWASALMLLPPVIDMIKSGGEIYWSFYLLSSPSDLWKQFTSIFGHLPSGIVYYGTKITFIFAIVLCVGVIFAKTKDWIRASISAFAIYVILFFMGSFPSLFFYAYSFFMETKKVSSIKAFEIVQFFGSPQRILGIDTLDFKYALAYKVELFYYILLIFLSAALFFMISRKKFLAVFWNLRFPQLFYHAGLLFVGMGLGYLNFRENFSFDIFSLAVTGILSISVWLSWLASVVANDIYDLEIDKISNPNRPLPKGIFSVSEYAQFGVICLLLSLLGGITIGFNFFALLLVYQIIAWFYSAPPFRLKKFPGIATFTSALASIAIIFLGYILLSSDQTIYTLSWRIVLLFVICYTISIPIKDFKDIEGDKKYGIWTIPVIFKKDNARVIVAASHFVSYILSVFFLNESKLFFWAIVFGAINYAIVISKKIDSRRVFWWVLLTIFFYLLVMIKIVFVDNLGKFNF